MERWTTTDGSKWQWGVGGVNDNMRHPVQVRAGFFRTDMYSVDFSADGKKWTTAWLPDFREGTEYELWELCASGNEVVGVGRVTIQAGGQQAEGLDQNGFAIYSADGRDWIMSAGWPDLDLGYMTAVAAYGERIVAFGRGGAIASDYDSLGNPKLPYIWVSPPVP
jgi:hypothetical protein